MIELRVEPSRDLPPHRTPSSATYFTDFESGLAAVVHTFARAAHQSNFEVCDLFVGEPVVNRFADLRNGQQVSVEDAIELVIRMASVQEGPYCSLVNDFMRIESGWDRIVTIMLQSDDPPSDATGRWPGVRVSVRTEIREATDNSSPVSAVADDAFWRFVREAPGELKLLCERWAYGVHGSRWFRLGGSETDLRLPSIEPRSLVSVLIDPEVSLSRLDLDDGFIAFESLSPGIVRHKEFPFGVDPDERIAQQGWRYGIKDPDVWDRIAVVPDANGALWPGWRSPSVR